MNTYEKRLMMNYINLSYTNRFQRSFHDYRPLQEKMSMMIENSLSQLDKLLLILFIIAIVVGNISVLITYFIQGDHKYWPNFFILVMSSLDLVIGSIILPLRYIRIYNRTMNLTSCLTLLIGDRIILSAILYTMLYMIMIRLFNLFSTSTVIRWRYLIGLLIALWLVSCVPSYIPYFILNRTYQHQNLTVDEEDALNCIDQLESLSQPTGLIYTEIVLNYLLPIVLMIIGLVVHLIHLCRRQQSYSSPHARKLQHKTTRHVFILGFILLVLWLPWIIIRVMITFSDHSQLHRALKITFYILLLKSALFPIVYAATNVSFRVSFAIYRHKRIIPNRHV